MNRSNRSKHEIFKDILIAVKADGGTFSEIQSQIPDLSIPGLAGPPIMQYFTKF
jgi:hypothetical protein